MSSHVAHHFDDSEQQFDAARLGMWVFLATEVLFFGGLFTGYTRYRLDYSAAFAAGSESMLLLWGTVNTAVLLLSSFTMALAVRSIQTDRRRESVRLLLVTMAFGVVFLGIKGYEYAEKFTAHHFPGPDFAFDVSHHANVNPYHVELFFSFYFAMTGMHALHMIIGIALLSVICLQARRGRFSSNHFTPVEMMGLYWHFVDIIWVFLFPLFYLIT